MNLLELIQNCWPSVTEETHAEIMVRVLRRNETGCGVYEKVVPISFVKHSSYPPQITIEEKDILNQEWKPLYD